MNAPLAKYDIENVLYAVSVSGMRYALSGKNGKACKRTRVIPYVRIRHAIYRAAANGCVCGKTESLQVAIHAAKVC